VTDGPAEEELSLGDPQALRRRFEQTGDSSLLDRAVDIYALLVARHAGSAPVGLLVQYANTLLARYQAVGDLRDVDLAMEVGQRAVDRAGDSPGPRAVTLNVMATARTASFQARGVAADLFAALSAQREAVDLLDPGQEARVALAVNLANRLIFAFDVVREPSVLDEAVDVTRNLLAGAMPDGWRAAALNNLGLALRARFEATGDSDDLHASLSAQQEALDLSPAGSAERVNRLNNLANARWALYLSSGVLADLDEAVVAYEAAAAQPANPLTRATCLLGLGTARWNRWGRRKLHGDLNAAITSFTAAAELVDDTSPTGAHCALNLGAAYFARWRHTRQRSDLDLAVGRWETVRTNPAAAGEIVEAATSNLGGALWERYENAGDIADLHGAIEFLGAAPDEAKVTLKPGRVFTLAGALRRRHDVLGNEADLDRGVAAYRRACALGVAVNPGVALSSGQLWGEWATSRQAFGEADEAFTLATAAAIGLYRGQHSDEHTKVWLGQATTLAARHAFVQVRLGQVAAAAATLERGRAYVLSEALHRDGPVKPDPDAAGTDLGHIVAAGVDQS